MSKTQDPPVPVVFRTWPKKGDTIALFPTIPGTNDPATCQSYQHVGQHGAADPAIVRDTRPATPAEIGELTAELERIGYTVKPMRRISRTAYATRRAELAKLNQ